jgi:hypothetical protein
MGIGISIFLLAVGAVLAFAVDVTTSGIDLNTVGVVLMVVGALGLLLSLAFWSSWGGWRRGGDTYVVDGPHETVDRTVIR